MKVLSSYINNNYDKKIKILDMGCGDGSLVHKLLDLGFNAYGVDIGFKNGINTKDLLSKKRLQIIKGDSNRSKMDSLNYKIPFDDNYFDLVISDQTIEHVEDLEKFVKESFRVLKQNCNFLAYFPSKHKFIEPHVGIPFGGIFHSKEYIKLCCSLNFSFKKYRYENSYLDIYNYLKYKTHYRDENEIKYIFGKYYKIIDFKPRNILLNYDTLLSSIILKTPLGPYFFGKLWSKFIVAKKI